MNASGHDPGTYNRLVETLAEVERCHEAILRQAAVVQRLREAIRAHREAVAAEFRCETPIKADTVLWATLGGED